MDPFVGQIMPVGFNFAPQGWFLCQGQVIPIANYDALFALIGTTYGGDGQTTFGLPNLSGRVPLHYGQGPNLSNYDIGEVIGTEYVTLRSTQVGLHTHAFMTSPQPATSIAPDGTMALGVASAAADIFVYTPGALNPTATNLAPASIGQAGSAMPHENRQPYLALNFIICWSGIFPARN
jgi:microcystin-dependent protein